MYQALETKLAPAAMLGDELRNLAFGRLDDANSVRAAGDQLAELAKRAADLSYRFDVAAERRGIRPAEAA